MTEESSLHDMVEMLSAASHTASRSAMRHEAVLAVADAIAELPPDYQRAVQLHLIDGKALQETATIMSRSARSVQGLIDRVKKKMRAALGCLSRYQ
jgi:RNA polymerase sigma factor (sigma-70 family)